MKVPSPEQQAVLDSEARVRVVRAAPGSGKTWLVAKLVGQELERWPTPTSGMAALSFTRVGGEEIRKAVGHELSHPHFVGTIDAFLYRYVLRPHLRKCFPWFASPRLISGEWGPEHWGKYGPRQKATTDSGINLFGCVFIDEQGDRAVVAHKPHPRAQTLQRISDSDLDTVRKAKKEIWQKTGQLTHSDAALWASQVLNHHKFGPIVRTEIARRFPLLIVDELQDTGYFLGKSILLLLGEPGIRGVLVGDPDQAIYEFNGARPDLFDRFHSLTGATTLPLTSTRRFGSAIAAAAGHLKDSGGRISPATDKTGQAVLVHYADMNTDISRIVGAIKTKKGNAVIKVLVRQSATLEELTRRSAEPAKKLGCPSLNHMQRAVPLFRQGHQVKALAVVRAALDVAVLGHEGPADEQLRENKIDPEDWKAVAVKCLLRANAIPTAGNLFDWQTRVGAILDEEIIAFGLDQSLQFTSGKIKPKRLPSWDEPYADYVPRADTDALLPSDVPFKTVHSVKGETHDVSVFVCPDSKANRCPSTIWWSTDSTDREEKRIAYVAMTRTQGDLVVCVSNACYHRLCAQQPQFIASFDCKTVDEYVAMGEKGFES